MTRACLSDVFTRAQLNVCQRRPLQVMMQQVELGGLQGLTVDAILPLLVDPAHTEMLTKCEQRHADVRSDFSCVDVPVYPPNF